jgi:putative transposase
MRRFKSPEQAQRLLSTHSVIASHFRPRRHRLTAARYRAMRRQQFRFWNTTTESTAFAITA